MIFSTALFGVGEEISCSLMSPKEQRISLAEQRELELKGQKKEQFL